MRSVERARNVGPSFRELVHVGLVPLSSARLTFDPHVHVPATNCISLADFIRLIRASRYRNYGRGNASRNPENLCRHPPSPFDVPIFLSLPPFYPLASFFFFRESFSLSSVTDLLRSRVNLKIIVTFPSHF